MKIAPSIFAKKIPNRSVLRDFLINKMELYCPSLRELTSEFAKDILAGRKFLLKQN